MKKKIRDWYIKTYPTDELGVEITKDVTFGNVFEEMLRGTCFYEAVGVHDSIVRERVFEEMAKRLDCSYDTIYNLWLESEVTFVILKQQGEVVLGRFTNGWYTTGWIKRGKLTYHTLHKDRQGAEIQYLVNLQRDKRRVTGL